MGQAFRPAVSEHYVVTMNLEHIADKVRRAAASRRTRRSRCIAMRRRSLLGRLADGIRARKHPDGVVTYIIDRNVNYTNVCVARCNFCAFYREVGSPDGYVLGFEELFRKIDETIALGGVQILLQGGHNPDLPLDVVRGSVPRHQGALSRRSSCTRCRRPR